MPQEQTQPIQQESIDIEVNLQDALDAAGQQVAAAMSEIARQSSIIKAMERGLRAQGQTILELQNKLKELEPVPPAASPTAADKPS